MPVYNDWASVKIMLERIDTTFSSNHLITDILLVDDGSTEKRKDDMIARQFSAVANISLLKLKRNVGHQRAIAIALTYLYKSKLYDSVIIMDADGEDRPEDIPMLITRYLNKNNKKVIFAARKKRMEGFSFKFFYRCYQFLHKILTGHSIRVGNFSIVPYRYLTTLVVSSELWNHFAASIYKLKIPFEMVKISRGRRISGSTKMDFISLVVHGLSAISVFGETAGTRILVAAGSLCGLLIIGSIAVICIKFFTLLAVPGWATFTTGLLLILLLQVMSTSASFLFFVLNNRNASSFIPLRDYSLYINNTEQIYPNGGQI